MTSAPFTTRPELTGDFGMVASTHYLASSTGMSVLERGGNAADAAVAAAFVLQVVEPHLNGPAGEAPILLWDPTEERVEVIAGQGVTPQAATIAHFDSLGLTEVPGTGLLAATVPGAMAAWLLLLQRWGTWSLRAVLEPAIGIAEQGWPMLPQIAETIQAVAGTFRRDWPTSAATWLPGDQVPAVGSRMTSPVLAATWRRIIDEAEMAGADRSLQIDAARRAFYEGFVAEAIAAHCTREVRDSTGEPHAGLLTGDDLAGWQCPVEDPVTFDYGPYTVCKTGPWGQGPVFLQQLSLLSGFDLDAAGFLSADYLHTVVECGKLAFADREAWYGDPNVVDVPLATLLSEEYAVTRRALIGPAASTVLRPGRPDGREPRVARLRTAASGTAGAAGAGAAGAGEPTVAGFDAAGPAALPGGTGVDADGTTRGDTCHLDVVDRSGMMISATPSGGWLQSSPTIADLGFPLGSRAQMAWLEPDLASSLRPGSRPRTTLSPSFALRDGRPWLAFGTPGGDQQDQWSLMFFLSLVHGRLGLQAAIDAPNMHSNHFPSSFWPRRSAPAELVVEPRFGSEVIQDLRGRGHLVEVAPDWTLGRLSAVAVDPTTGFLRAAANPRGSYGYAVGR